MQEEGILVVWKGDFSKLEFTIKPVTGTRLAVSQC